MIEPLVAFRVAAFTVLGCSLLLARLLGGRSVANVAFWNGLGMLTLYACYCFSGIAFGNGASGPAELITAALVAAGVVAFVEAKRRCSAPASAAHRGRPESPIPPVSRGYLWLVVLACAVFYVILTQGQPWRLLTDGVGLKADRLQDIADKSPVLLNLDALVLSLCMLAFAWAIVAYRDDRRSKLTLAASLLLMLIYVASTGSRTPLIAIFLQAVPAVAEARRHSAHMAWLARKKWVLALILVAAVGFMILTTGSRIEVEALSDDVFYFYFNLTDFGFIGSWLKAGDAAAFFGATAVTYAASTYNNVVIRIQELDAVSVSVGYKFVFYYLSAAQILLPGLLTPYLADWRDLATTNNDHLGTVSAAAGQWATPYGDLVWDFGIVGAFIGTVVLFGLAGAVVGRARAQRSFAATLLKVVVVGFALSPLVNPLLSLYVHYLVAITLLVGWWSRRSRSRRHHVRRGRDRPITPLGAMR
jgi:hypothetical protein